MIYNCRYLVFGLLSILLFAGCHFGDGEDGLYALSKTTRSLSYPFTLALTSPSDSLCLVQDCSTNGLAFSFGTHAEIAVYGHEFRHDNDSLDKLDIQPLPIILKSNYYDRKTLSYQDGQWLWSSAFQSKARHSNGEEYSTRMLFLYPSSKAVDGDGLYYPIRTDSIYFSFAGQDGLLSTLREKYYVALGEAKGICQNKTVTLIDSPDSCYVGHDHQTQAERQILLDSKVAILRLSLIVHAQEDMTLIDYLQSRSQSGIIYYISNICISNQHEQAPYFSHSVLNLKTGHMEGIYQAESQIRLTDTFKFNRHSQIRRPERQDLSSVGVAGDSWGTSLYVSLPCTDRGQLDFDPLIDVMVRTSDEEIVPSFHLYGRVQSETLVEGGYYLTTPIALSTEKEQTENLAKFCIANKNSAKQ